MRESARSWLIAGGVVVAYIAAHIPLGIRNAHQLSTYGSQAIYASAQNAHIDLQKHAAALDLNASDIQLTITPYSSSLDGGRARVNHSQSKHHIILEGAYRKEAALVHELLHIYRIKNNMRFSKSNLRFPIFDEVQVQNLLADYFSSKKPNKDVSP